MKRKLLMISVVSAMLLAGCSSGPKADYGVRDGVVFNGKDTVAVEVHGGYEASGTFAPTGDPILITQHTNFDDCPNNTAGIMSTDVGKDGDFSYFIMYLGTELVMHQEVDGMMNCAYLRMNQQGIESNVAIQAVKQAMTGLQLLNGNPIATIDDTVFIQGAEQVEVRSSGLTVPGCFIVQKGSVQTTSTVDVGETTVGFISQNGYDYYQFGEYCVKAVVGYDISPYVTFVSK